MLRLISDSAKVLVFRDQTKVNKFIAFQSTHSAQAWGQPSPTFACVLQQRFAMDELGTSYNSRLWLKCNARVKCALPV